MKNTLTKELRKTPAVHRSLIPISHSDRRIHLDRKLSLISEAGRLPNDLIREFPELGFLCRDVLNTGRKIQTARGLQPFVNILGKFTSPDPARLSNHLRKMDRRQVLLSNNQFELVLIQWKPGHVSEIHGHNGAKCLFKVLTGKLEELRFTPDTSCRLFAACSMKSGDLNYIDDSIGYHQVGNPFGSPALSLHLYLKQN